ncbi:DNA cross-link repair 1A protein [Oncorhynchus tshawytscha]|uniref:DNA cross-link repair 1A protein n=1 Tax=Oncorhynchus tshawytscha TaxID=74940 RepID=A0AAZ3PMD3_ONCTS|nr:DNA cross-link repair 1A protein [Oncorhynchus tshawytscha]
MSKNDLEDDIWEYKPLKKKKRKDKETPDTFNGSMAKYRQASQCLTKGETSVQVKKSVRHVKLTKVAPNKTLGVKENESIQNKEVARRTLSTQNIAFPQSTQDDDSTRTAGENVHRASSPGGSSCPICQMPFSILVVQSQRWHVAECLDNPGEDRKECPDGIQCYSTILSHYQRYSHSLLAHSRATNEAPCLSLELVTNGGANLSLESSQDSQSSSPINRHSGATSRTKPNALLLLRSPAPEVIRKKKGWSPSTKVLKSTLQDNKTKVSTPHKDNRGSEGLEGGFVKAEPSASSDDEISYSPMSEFPQDIEVNGTQPKKALFPSSMLEDGENNDSMLLFSDGVSSDNELFSNLVAHSETNEVVGSPVFSDSQVVSISSLVHSNHLPSFSREEHTEDNCNAFSARPPLQSPKSIVLESLRESLFSPSSNCSLHSKSLDQCPTYTNTELNMSLPQVPPSSQASPTQHSQATMTTRKGKASGLKQTDIGVFFGLNHLKDKGKEQEAGNVLPGVTLHQGPVLEERKGGKEDHGGHQRKGRSANATVTPKVGVRSDGGSTQTPSEGGRKRWNRGRTDGEQRESKRCPFYKKIPGTKFAVDAFQYGLVEGITTYFLTHFHSDHYGGLKKSSTFHIYCNRITGNLVKSKLRVAEQYVHILPMNTQVTVDGFKVTMLDANHCPGAAMLLLFLPDGQTVLHTGDFRADPSMEAYHELLSCRVQTLYLDTTYCSPEYTFPTQQEVINLAANTAFMCVTLNPRTLVVCGSYSVGKEKVFLALAEVLGSKVCLSRDKFNTMCCLESERIRQLITTDWKAAQVHVLPMMQLNFKNLQAHLSRFSRQYDQLVAFKPTGWTFSQRVEAVEDIKPMVHGNISIYGIPYSEHSSYLELRRFVQWLRPLKIIPTVNVGSWASRKAMERCFSEWLTEAYEANNIKGI